MLSITTLSAIASASPAHAAAQAKTKTLRYGIRFDETVLDLGAPGPSLGDVQILNDHLVDRRGTVVGHDGGTLHCHEPGPAGNEVRDHLLPARRADHEPIPELAAATQDCPITGGTRRYRDARGDLVLTENPGQTGTIVFRFTRPKR